MLLLVSVAAIVVFLIASYCDLRHRSIPNSLPVAVAAAALVKWLVVAQLATTLWAAAAAAIVFVVTAIMFAQGWIGGGDVKLAVAAVFLLGAPATPQFLLLMALFGGVLAVAILIAPKRPRAPSEAATAPAATAAERQTVPYGVAIAAAAIATIALDGGGPWAM